MLTLQKFNKKYRLKNGNVYWHKLYFSLVPEWSKKYCPPFGWYNWAWYFYNPHKYFIHLWKEAKWFLQRGRRGYSNQDVWGWCDYMARTNSAALRQLASMKNGHPLGMTLLGWKSRLLKMADGFQAVIDEENDFKSHKLPRRQYMAVLRARNRRLRVGLTLYRDHFKSLWD